MSMFLLTYGVCNFNKICVPDLVKQLAVHEKSRVEVRTLVDRT
jgi:hypothetical protein